MLHTCVQKFNASYLSCSRAKSSCASEPQGPIYRDPFIKPFLTFFSPVVHVPCDARHRTHFPSHQRKGCGVAMWFLTRKTKDFFLLLFASNRNSQVLKRRSRKQPSLRQIRKSSRDALPCDPNGA